MGSARSELSLMGESMKRLTLDLVYSLIFCSSFLSSLGIETRL